MLQHPFCYIDTLDMEYLGSEYGLQTKITVVELNTTELVVQTAVSKALQIVDRHLSYWGRTNSKITTDILITAKRCLVGLLSAVRF